MLFIERDRDQEDTGQEPASCITFRHVVFKAVVFVVQVGQRIRSSLFFRIVFVVPDTVEGFLLIGSEVDKGSDFILILFIEAIRTRKFLSRTARSFYLR